MDERETIEHLRVRLDAERGSRRQYESLFQRMGQGYCELELVRDADGRAVDQRYIEFNPAFERIFGISVADAKGRLASEVFPDLEPWWHGAFDRIAAHGEPERVEHAVASLGRWFEVLVYPGGGDRLTVLYEDVSARRRAEDALRASERRQAFLLRLSDALRDLSDAVAIQGSACRILADHLSADRACYVEVDEARGVATVGEDHTREGSPSLAGEHPVASFSWSVDILRRGECHVVVDARTSPVVPDGARESLLGLQIVSCMGAPLVKAGRLVGALCVTGAAPRAWSEADVDLLRDVGERIWAAVERARAEATLRDSEERQAFLLGLGDALRRLADPVEIMAVASRALGTHLRVGRCGFGEVDATGEVFVVARDWTDGVMASFQGRHLVAGFGPEFVEAYRAGRSVLIEDALADPRAHGAEAAFAAAGGVRASLGLPLIKGSRFVAGLFAQQLQPRRWTAKDERLAQDVAERTWAAVERARAEAALGESEERFAQFAASSSDALWIRDAETLAMEYVSPAIRDIYGVPPEAILGEPRRWAALIVPEDRGTALEHLGRARDGEATTHEFRILRPSDQSFRWIRDTDFPLLDKQGRVQRIGGLAEDVTEAKLAAEHGRILLLELQHRVRNIMAMIRSMADQTGDTVDDAGDYRDRLHGRLTALARVQTLLTREANAGVDLATLVEAELSAQAAHAGQYAAAGPQLRLAPKAAEVLTLAIHELATNALKYGAFSHAAGRLAVAWSTFYDGRQPWLRIDWTESGAAAPLPPPRREGFGTTLVRERIPYELKGRGSLGVGPDGLTCRLELPLRPGDSILETDAAVLSAGISGGSLDMAGEADLTGCSVLVVEDDYYLAMDAARALRRAGAGVIGPVGDAAEALASIAQGLPRCALVDINLGEGPHFEVAEALERRGVPFVFVTGYDDVVIPARFDAVERLRKPVDVRQIVRAAAQMCAA